jgi:threonine/homoserine/homoserine lactone efflux protein
MIDLLPQLIVLALGGSIAPALLLLTILFLGSQRPLPNATALVLGYFAVCAAVGVAGLILFSGTAGAAGSTASTIGRVISVTLGVLLIVLGLRRLFITRDPDASLPRWMEAVSSITPARAFGIGMMLFPLQIRILAIFVACINLIATASLRTQESIVALVLMLLIFAIPVLVLIGLYTAVPQRASNMLESLRRWMEKNNRAITVVLCFVFGAFFLVRGFSGP